MIIENSWDGEMKEINIRFLTRHFMTIFISSLKLSCLISLIIII